MYRTIYTVNYIRSLGSRYLKALLVTSFEVCWGQCSVLCSALFALLSLLICYFLNMPRLHRMTINK